MFVQLSVAGVVVLFILSGVFMPDEIFQRAAEEILYDENEENSENADEAVTYWRKAVGSLDLTLAVSAGLGTLLTAILSYRFSQARLANMGHRLHRWIFKKNTPPVKVIMQPSDSLFLSESKECLTDQFHETTDFGSTSTNSDGINTDGKEDSECYDTASASCEEKNQEIDLKVEEIDEILKASEKCSDKSEKSKAGEPTYQTLEARLVAVEGSLMRDIDSRMKIFEQQLDEFRNKIRGTDSNPSNFTSMASESDSDRRNEYKIIFDDSDHESGKNPSKCVLEEVTVTYKNAIPSKRYSSSKSGANAFTERIGDTSISPVLDNDTKDNISTTSGDFHQGDSMSYKSSDGGSEAASEPSGYKKSSIPTTINNSPRKNPVYKNHVKTETKSEQQVMRPDSAAVKLQRSNPGPRKSAETSPPPANTNRRGQRSRQQIKAILQHTNEKLTQRKLKQANRT